MDSALLASLDVVVLSRAAERILLLAVGALAIYLGFNLFRFMPSVNKAEGKLELPGGVSIFLTRIGPGVFFALFGCAIIGYSVTKPVQLTLPVANPGVIYIGSVEKYAPAAAITYSGVGQRDRPTNPIRDTVISGPDPEVVVARLNGFFEDARRDMDALAAAELEETIRAAKFAVMLTRWKPEWGDRDKFERWARENGDRDPPDDLVPGATLVYRTVL